jgi:hypothetical protein
MAELSNTPIYTGSSIAASVVSGTAATIWQFAPSLRPSDVVDILAKSPLRAPGGTPRVVLCSAALEAMRIDGSYASTLAGVAAQCTAALSAIAAHPAFSFNGNWTDASSPTTASVARQDSSADGTLAVCVNKLAGQQPPGQGPTCGACGFGSDKSLHLLLGQPVDRADVVVDNGFQMQPFRISPPQGATTTGPWL